MNFIEIFLLAVALGIDCLIVSFSQGLIFFSNRIKISLILAFIMGFFQGFMPCIGYLGADYVYEWVQPISKWLVFIIFMILGLKFIFEAFQKKENPISCLDIKCLLGLGIATSIDALVAGASLKLTNSLLFLSVVVIALVSFIMSTIGFWFGNFFKRFNSAILEIIGGLILIFLAFKSLFF